MTIKNSGSLAITEIVSEFGGDAPHGMDEYYAGSSYVQTGASGINGAIPSSGSIAVSQFYGAQRSVVVDILIVAGGGGGSRGGGDNDVGNGGGGAGSVVTITGGGPILGGTSWYASIGAGGAGGYNGGDGGNTTFAGYTAYGGGGGGASDWGYGRIGGCGGGSAGRITWNDDGYGNIINRTTVGVGQSGSAWPSGSGRVNWYGYNGGIGTGWGTAGGGGGAGGAGGSPNGGNGIQWLDGNYYAGGGGGNTNGAGGSGIGGNGETWLSYCEPNGYAWQVDAYGNSYYGPTYYGRRGGNGVVNTGSGGGAGSSGRCNGPGGNGASGVVIVRYPGSTAKASGGTIYTSGGYVYHKFTSSGTWTFT